MGIKFCVDCGCEVPPGSSPRVKRCLKCWLEAKRERRREYRRKEKGRGEDFAGICEKCGREFTLRRGSVAKRKERGAGLELCSRCLTASVQKGAGTGPRMASAGKLTHRVCRVCGARLPLGYYMYCPEHHHAISAAASGEDA